MSEPAILTLNPKVSGLGSAIVWFRDHDLSHGRIAEILGISPGHVRLLAFRDQWRIRRPRILGQLEDLLRPPADPFGPVPDEVRRTLKIRSRYDSEMVKPDRASSLKVEALDDQLDQLGAQFWSGVRYGIGLKRFGNILAQLSSPADYRKIRLLARVRQLLAETYAHAGYSSSAIEQGLASLVLSLAAHDNSGEALDLERYAKTALIVSQGHLLRNEPDRAAHYLDLHRDARERIRAPLGGEYFRQRGVVAFQSGPDGNAEACKNFGLAMQILAETVEYGRNKEFYEVLNIGTRQMNLLGKPNWESAAELVNYMVTTLPPGDIHIPMNVNWAVACAFSIDSPKANQDANDLLSRYRAASAGFGHQATVAWLLSLTAELPEKIRAAWVRHALYENTFKNR